MKTRSIVFGLLLTLPCSTVPSSGATNMWRSGSGFWTDTANWLVPTAPTEVDDVFFDSLRDGAGGWVRLNGGPAGLQFRTARSITFLEGTGSYLLDGNTGGGKKELQLGEGGIVNASTNLQVFDTQIFVSASQVWDAQRGDILAEDVVHIGDNTLTITGDNDVTVNGPITGSGGLIKNGVGTLTLGGSNAYTGDTVLNFGTLTFAMVQNLSGSLVLNGGLLDVNDQSLSIGPLLLGGDATLQLGDDATSQSIWFTDSLWTAGKLTISGWSSEAGSDQVGVLIEPSQDLLNHIQFEGFALGALWSDGLLLPIPEPSASWLATLGSMSFLVIRAYRRRASGGCESTSRGTSFPCSRRPP